MEWDNGVTIGYSDGADFFLNNIPSTSEVACLNLPVSNFSNVIYRLSSADPEIPPPGIVDSFIKLHSFFSMQIMWMSQISP